MYNILRQNLDFIENVSYIKSRKIYSNRLLEFENQNNIVVITWLRRAGKSSIILDFLKGKKDIFYFSKELDVENKIKNQVDLKALFDTYLKKNNAKYIVIDEIQDIENWEMFVRWVYALKRYKIIITWSNSNLLSSELSTYLSWRYISIRVYPFSFCEYLDFNWMQYSEENLIKFLTYWWLPEVSLLDSDNLKKNYLNSIRDSIILKDIVTRYSIRDLNLYSSILRFLSDNIWQLTTWRNLAKFLKNQWIKLSLASLLDYILFTENSFVIEKVNRFDIKWKKILEINNKYYFEDLGLRNAIIWNFSTQDISQLLENFVYNELKNKWYQIFIWNIWDYEIDFIAEKDWEVKYFQVSYLLNENSFEREIGSLLKIKDNFPKYIVTLDKFRKWTKSWIKIIWIEEFLDI